MFLAEIELKFSSKCSFSVFCFCLIMKVRLKHVVIYRLFYHNKSFVLHIVVLSHSRCPIIKGMLPSTFNKHLGMNQIVIASNELRI